MLSEVQTHAVYVVCELFPHTLHARHISLATQSTLRADFTRYTRYFVREMPQLVHHDVDGDFELENLAVGLNLDLFRQITSCNSLGDQRHAAHLVRKVLGQAVHHVFEFLPCALHTRNVSLAAELALCADFQ